ncbi:hypothetical protein CEXT_722861 [Caerostris extrusa]|uniref:Uncharacterized protein n=1 Tax=Caerostris extrusa TaxID=172846 RepID=A0AAV4RBN1_CAEEX|nr:hypothetical protein CEXT_722861 [Caerostris extrusa]
MRMDRQLWTMEMNKDSCGQWGWTDSCARWRWTKAFVDNGDGQSRLWTVGMDKNGCGQWGSTKTVVTNVLLLNKDTVTVIYFYQDEQVDYVSQSSRRSDASVKHESSHDNAVFGRPGHKIIHFNRKTRTIPL